MQPEVHQEMADAYTRLGQYRDAAAEWTVLLRLMPREDPERAEIEEGLSMWESLGDVAAQWVEFGGNVPVQARYDMQTEASRCWSMVFQVREPKDRLWLVPFRRLLPTRHFGGLLWRALSMALTPPHQVSERRLCGT